MGWRGVYLRGLGARWRAYISRQRCRGRKTPSGRGHGGGEGKDSRVVSISLHWSWRATGVEAWSTRRGKAAWRGSTRARRRALDTESARAWHARAVATACPGAKKAT